MRLENIISESRIISGRPPFDPLAGAPAPLLPGSSGSMAYHPFLLQRPTDFSVNSLLSSGPPYLPSLGLPPGGPSPYSLLPKLPSQFGQFGDDILSSPHLRPLRSLVPDEDGVIDDPKVNLECNELWQKFHKLGTEMVITKSGR